MIKLLNNYRYRYTNPEYVYCISKQTSIKQEKSIFYSIPHIPKEQEIKTNVLVGFVDQRMAIKTSRFLQKRFNSPEITTLKITTNDFKYISFIMNMPIIIIMNKYDVDTPVKYDLYYYYKRDKDIFNHQI